jgi:hypothetical protein
MSNICFKVGKVYFNITKFVPKFKCVVIVENNNLFAKRIQEQLKNTTPL